MDSNKKSHGYELNQPILQPKSSVPVPERLSSELEEVLSDTSVSCFVRVKKATTMELKTLFTLAGPAIIVYLLNNVTSMSTQIFCGHLGNLELAASSLGNNGIQLFAYGVMVLSIYNNNNTNFISISFSIHTYPPIFVFICSQTFGPSNMIQHYVNTTCLALDRANL